MTGLQARGVRIRVGQRAELVIYDFSRCGDVGSITTLNEMLRNRGLGKSVSILIIYCSPRKVSPCEAGVQCKQRYQTKLRRRKLVVPPARPTAPLLALNL